VQHSALFITAKKKRTATLFKLGDRMESDIERCIYLLTGKGNDFTTRAFENLNSLGLRDVKPFGCGYYVESTNEWELSPKYYTTKESALKKKESEGKKLEKEGYAKIINDLLEPEADFYFKKWSCAVLMIERITALQSEILDENGILSYKGNLLRA
jgi:hypothetical protein